MPDPEAGSNAGLAEKEPAPFTPRVDSSATMQAQHQMGNDFPLDVNPNAVVGRAQMETLTLMGKNFEANADRRNKMFDQLSFVTKPGGA